jgi:(p)ppGpp synthase/HD superfamily hydrolase
MDEKIVGVLHDVVEDADWTFERLVQERFPTHITHHKIWRKAIID